MTVALEMGGASPTVTNYPPPRRRAIRLADGGARSERHGWLAVGENAGQLGGRIG